MWTSSLDSMVLEVPQIKLQNQQPVQQTVISPYSFDWSFVDSIDPHILKFKPDAKLMKALSSQISKAPFAPLDNPQRAQKVFQITQVLLDSSSESNEKCAATVKDLKSEIQRLKSEIDELKREPKGVIGNRCPCCLKVFESLAYLDVHFFSKHPQLAIVWNIVRQPKSIAMNSTQLAAALEPFVQHESESNIPSVLKQIHSQLQVGQQLSEQKVLDLISEKMSTFENRFEELQSTLRRDDTMTQVVHDSSDDISDILPRKVRRKSSARRESYERHPNRKRTKDKRHARSVSSDSDYEEQSQDSLTDKKPKLRLVVHDATEVFPEDGPRRIESPKAVVPRQYGNVTKSQPLPRRVGKERLIEIVRQRLAKRKEEKEREKEIKAPEEERAEASYIPERTFKVEEPKERRQSGGYSPLVERNEEQSLDKKDDSSTNSYWDKEDDVEQGRTNGDESEDMSMEDILVQAEREAGVDKGQSFVTDDEQSSSDEVKGVLSSPQSHAEMSSETKGGFRITSDGEPSNDNGIVESDHASVKFAVVPPPAEKVKFATQESEKLSQDAFDMQSSPWISEEQLTADSWDRKPSNSGSDVIVEDCFSSDIQSEHVPVAQSGFDDARSSESDNGDNDQLTLNDLAMPVTPIRVSRGFVLPGKNPRND